MDKPQLPTDKIAQLQVKLATHEGRSQFKIWLRGVGLVVVLILVMQLGLVHFWFQPSCDSWAKTLSKPVASVDYSTPSGRPKHVSGVRNCSTGCCKVEFVDGSSKSVTFSDVSFWKSWTALLLNLEVDFVIAASLVYFLYLRRHDINFRALFAK